MRITFPLVALAAIATPVAAASAQDVVDVRISIAGVDANSTEGRAEIEARIEAELRKACTVETAYSYRKSVVDQTCVADARAQALAQVDRMAVASSRAGNELAAN